MCLSVRVLEWERELSQMEYLLLVFLYKKIPHYKVLYFKKQY